MSRLKRVIQILTREQGGEFAMTDEGAGLREDDDITINMTGFCRS